MGKGKKKGGKDKDERKDEPSTVEASTSAVASMSISETPSTSQSPPADDEEECSGLTGGGKRRKPKKKTKQETAAETVAPAVAEVKTEPTPSSAEVKAEPEKPQQQEDESVGLGLGLGGGGRRRPKKSGQKQNVGSSLAASTPGEPAQVQATQSQPLQGQPEPTLQKDQPWAKPSTAPPGFSGPGPGHGRGRGGGWGRGAGQGDFGGQGRSAPTAQLPSSAGAPPFQPGPVSPQAHVPAYTAIPASASSSMIQPKVTTTATPRSSGTDTALCRFKVPKKILGNTVPVRLIQVLTNYLKMDIKPLKVFRYDVQFKPDRPKKLLGKAFQVSKQKHFPKNIIAFDQIKNCYTIERMGNVSQTDRFITNVEILDTNGRTMAFEVSYKFTGIVDLGTLLTYMQTGGTSLSPPTEAIQCIDVVLRQGTLENYVKAGRQFFQRPSKPIDLGDGLEMWTGLFQSGIFTSRPFINIDVAHKGFPRQQSMVEALQRDFRLDPRYPIDTQRGRGVENFHHFLKGLRVVAKVGGDSTAKGQKREFICNGLVGSATKERFAFEDPTTKAKKSMSVAEYFTRIKGVRLQYPDLNCIWVGPREKTIYYPIELLEVAYGQAINKQLNEMQLSTMVRQAATPPDQRKRKIEEVIKNMNYSNNPTFTKFGLSISNEFYPVKAKILVPPKLEVGRGQVLEPRKGAWQANQVYRPETLQSWGFIAIECDPSRCDFDAVKDTLMRMGRQMGMTVSEPMMTRYNVNFRDLQNVLFDALHKEVKFLFIVVSARGRDYYHRVKQLAERDVGILTQCLKEQTAGRMNMQTAKNILLKVNSKLMGINQALDARSIPKCIRDGGVMVVGADVTHPSPEQSCIPSIAAVTASMDPQCFKYNIELSIQTPKKEMIVEFEDMMVDHLKIYRQKQKVLPKKIFVFRDGVSEGQFAQVMNSELQAVHNAYKLLAGPNAKPEVLFLLVQKRHHTRLFVPNSADNVEPGTVVDTEIVHASELDFYLVSHQAIKGTARPTRYHAVCNDGQIPHDEVEQLTYYLCHLYSRCMRAVSYPTPTYYAHLACLRARSLTHGEKFDNKELETKPKRLRVMDKILQYSRMFFV